MTADQLKDLAKQILDVKIWNTDDRLERASLDAGSEALLAIARRMSAAERAPK